MFLLLLISCEVTRFARPTTAASTVVAGGGGDEGGGDDFADASPMTLFLKNVLNMGLSSASASTGRPEPTSAEPKTRTCDKNIIRAFINLKVKELMPFLQDDHYTEADSDEWAAAGGDTDVVRLRPRTRKKGVRRYRRLRKRIHRALLRETVSNGTVDLITRTIDEMIANMMAGRCGRSGGGAQRSIPAPPPPRPSGAEDLVARPAIWRLEWQKIREKYSDLFQGNDSVSQNRRNEIVGSLMEKLQSFFDNVVQDGESFAEGYGIRCELARSRPVPRSRPPAHNDTCNGTTWICSGELSRFLLRLYKSVNESGARVLSDYLEMYKIDVNIDGARDRRGIVNTLRDINRDAETDICNIYAKTIQSLKINKVNMRDLYSVDLRDLIKNIIENVIMHINQIIRVQMEPIDSELKERIMKDLDGNMRVELDRLAADADRTICSAFASCNGRYTVRSEAGAGVAGRGVYVRVQLQLDVQPALASAPAPRRTSPPAPRRTSPPAPRRTSPPAPRRTSHPASPNYIRSQAPPIQTKYSTFKPTVYDMKQLDVKKTTEFHSANSNTIISQ